MKTHPNDISFYKTNIYDVTTETDTYYDPDPKDNDDERMTLGFNTLMDVQRAADECRQDEKNENAWCQEVVRRILKTALHKLKPSTCRLESVYVFAVEATRKCFR